MARGNITIAVTGTYNDRDIKNAIRDLQALQTKAAPAAGAFQKLGASFSAMPTQMLGQFLGVGAAIAAVTAALELAHQAIQTMISSAAEDERAMRSLEVAMANVGQSSQLVATQETIDRLSRMSGVADDQLIPAMRTLVLATGSAATAQDLLSLAMDVSAGTGKSLESVVAALGRASLGSTTALSRLGAGIDKATLSSGNFGLITDQLGQKFSGQAAAAADTYSGKMDRIGVAVSEAGEAIGYQLTAAIEKLIEALGGPEGITAQIKLVGDQMAMLTGTMGNVTSSVFNSIGGFSGLKNILYNLISASFPQLIQVVRMAETALGWLDWTQRQINGNTDTYHDSLAFATSAANSAGGAFSDLADETAAAGEVALSASNGYLKFYQALVATEQAAAQGARDLAGTSGTVSSAIADGVRGGAASGYWQAVTNKYGEVERAARGAGGAAAKAGDDASASVSKWQTASTEIATATASLVTAVQGSTAAMVMGPLDSLTTNLGATMTAVTSQMALKADEMGAGMVNAFSSRITRLSETVQSAVDKAKQAVDALNSYSQGVVSNVMGNLFQVSTTDQAGNALSPESIFNNILGGADAWQGAAGNIAPFLTKLPEQVATQLYQLPPTQIQAIADYFSANPAMLERLTQRYNELAVWTETNLGIPMAETFAKVGDQSAAEMLKSARKTISESAAAFTSFVKSKLATTIDVDVVYHARGAGIPGRASGGPVSASAAYVVGEMGPELFVPNVSGSIIPNSGLLSMPTAGRGGGGNTYSITVQAGIGDPREIGRQVVEVVKAYERASGPVFVSV